MTQHVDIIIERLKGYIDHQIATLAQNNPIIALSKPLITRIVNNNSYKVEYLLKQISDKDGLIDIDELLSEMTNNIINTKPFKVKTEFLGELEIGGGKIKMNIPLMNKDLVFDQKDLIELKDMLNR